MDVMKLLILSCMLAFSASATFGQGYQFTEVVTVPATPVKNSGNRDLLVLCHYVVYGIRTASYGERHV